jgi:hypothetical protein
MKLAEEYRSIDGSNNNIKYPNWGKPGIPLIRIARTSKDPNKPNPRDISNIVLVQASKTYNAKSATDHFWVWGQFLDHDIVLTPTNPNDKLDIAVPQGDPYFDPSMTGTVAIPFERSQRVNGQQINIQSSFVDASNVYGSNASRASALRTNDGSGKLKTRYLDLPEYNLLGHPNAPDTSRSYYLAGDVRANVQPLLTAYHAIWVREHNRLVSKMSYDNPSVDGETLYQEARRRVIALNQIITYNEFMPLLLGKDGLNPYTGYKPHVNPGIINEFATAGYRLGHSLVPSELLRLDSNLKPISKGHLKLKDAFFNPKLLAKGNSIEPLMRGAAVQICENLDAKVVNDLRNHLFGNPGDGGMDLGALNIQRGRDHGLPSYNDMREDLGLSRKKSFKEITSDVETTSRLTKIYKNIDEIDAWVGGLSEDPHAGSMLGELFFHLCKTQFEVIRDGDRFWYQGQFDQDELKELESTTWADVIRRNTSIKDEIQDEIFKKSHAKKYSPWVTKQLEQGALIVPT